MFERVRDWSVKNLPTRESLEGHPWLRPVAHRILLPELWRFTRRSVPRGVALGLLVGIFLLIPGIQIAGAAFLALPFRANIPVAAAMTFLSNPATTPLILVGSLYIGNDVLGLKADMNTFYELSREHASIGDYARWLLSDAAPAVITGLALIAIVSAVVGYFLSIILWRMWIGRKWRHRQHLRTFRALPRDDMNP